MQKGTIMEDENTLFDDVQEGFVDPDEEAEEVETEVDTEDEEGEAVHRQSAEENAKFASFRRDTEAARAEAAKAKRQNDVLLKALEGFGYTGSPEEIADLLVAANTEMSVEEARAEREKKEQRDVELEKVKSQNKQLTDIAIQKLMADDLAKIQAVYPDVKSLTALGKGFFDAMKVTHDPVLSYEIIAAKKNVPKKQTAETKEHFVKTAGRSGITHEAEIPGNELATWQDSFPNDSMSQLKTRYNRALKRQEGA